MNKKVKNRNTRSCKKCKHLDYAQMMCNSFKISVSSTSNARYCKNYSEFTNKIPKKKKYRHSSSKLKYNKYDTN